MTSYIFCKNWDFSKRISPKLFGISGSNFQRWLKLFFSIFRGVILLASSDDERRMLMRQKM